jgi:hypothetical protein
MALKACRSLTFILLLSLSVVTLTAAVSIPTVVASTSPGGTTNGDPDSPKDTGPRPAQTQSAPTPVNVAVATVSPTSNVRQVVSWMWVQHLLSSLLGRPGLLR